MTLFSRTLTRAGRPVRSVTISLVTGLAALAAITITAPAAHASGSYSISSWTQPSMYNVRIISNGSTYSAGAAGTITSLNGALSFTTQPAGMVYRAYLCMDAADTMCYYVGPSGIYGPSSHSWSYSIVPAGSPRASTTFHLAVYVDDGSTGGTYAALNPSQYLLSRSATINYS